MKVITGYISQIYFIFNIHYKYRIAQLQSSVSAEAASPILVFVMYIVNESEVSVVCIIE